MPFKKKSPIEEAKLLLKNERVIYGSLLPMVKYLRSREWVVYKEGPKDQELFRVGTKLMDAAALIAKYHEIRDREARHVVLVDTQGPQAKTKKGKARKASPARRPNRGRNRSRR